MAKGGNTRSALIESGKSEFLKHGFERASLRTICTQAGVTTGAFYAHFKKKEDLFAAIVEDDLAGLLECYDTLEKQVTSGDSENMEAGYAFMDYLIDHRDLIYLLLDCSEGTRYEGYEERLTRHMEESYQCIFDARTSAPFDSDITKLVVKLRFAFYREMLENGYTKERVHEIMLRLRGFGLMMFDSLVGEGAKG